MARLIYHGHSTFTLETADGTRLVIDPFFDENPRTDLTVAEVEADYILCTHGHSDHFADAIPLARRTGARLISTFEIVSFAETRGVENAHAMHIGGGFDFPFGRVKMTPALHGGQVAGDDTGAFTTVPGGFLVHVDGKTVYHAGDTALLTDMQLLKGAVDVALLPIGDNFTMGPADAVRAVEFIEPEVVVPIHYDTWEIIRQDAQAFREAVGARARVEVMAPGDSYDV
ncbi:MAG: metal-dependent hydrolase [Gemmatimonadota bacterium]|nr:metal-dependent hydrolase [Gemmatimonadota bacterium]MDH5758000.1 metal-dependent hydrolase [Gemmatimonadota bacterium]